MKAQVRILRKTEYLLIVLALTVICGLVAKGVYFMYYGTEVCKMLTAEKKLVAHKKL